MFVRAARSTCGWGPPWAGTACVRRAGARGEKQLGNGAGRHCVCAAGEKHMSLGVAVAAGEQHMGGGASP